MQPAVLRSKDTSAARPSRPEKRALSERARRIVEHLVVRIAAAPIENEPYQNFFQTAAFPDDIYAEMRERLPKRECYLPLNIRRWKNAAGQSTRDRLVLSEGELERVASEDRAFWSDVTDALMSQELQQAVYARMTQDIALRLKCPTDRVLEQIAWPTAMLVRDFEDYRLRPHPDGPPRVVTMMFYLAKDGDPNDLGTSVYVERPLLSRIFGRRFKEVKRFPFLPNSVATFVVNDTPQRKSWHGRELIEGASIVRDSIIVAWLSQDFPEFGKKHNDY